MRESKSPFIEGYSYSLLAREGSAGRSANSETIASSVGFTSLPLPH
jgi:hypothetical protein